MNAMRVTELRLMKPMDKISQHEYVVACVTTKYLSLERIITSRDHQGYIQGYTPAIP
jgi:hypothetical protein